MPNIIVKDEIISGFSLPPGCSWNPTYVNGLKEGIVIVNDEFGSLYARLSYHQDMLNGLCFFYEKGRVIQKITFVNDVAEGWGCDCALGKETVWYFYKDGTKKSELLAIEGSNGYYEEIDIQTRLILSRCQYDEYHRITDIGYFYKNNQINRIAKCWKGKEMTILKRFEEDIMTEYDYSGSLVYKGQYLDSFIDKYPRNGSGIELQNGKRIYEGEWFLNHKEGSGVYLQDGLALYEGEWNDDKPNGKGVVYNEVGDVVYEGEWTDGIIDLNDSQSYSFEKKAITAKPMYKEYKMVVNINTIDDCGTLTPSVTEITIGEGFGRVIQGDWSICSFSYLRKLVVMKNVLTKITTLIISDNPKLQSIEIESCYCDASFEAVKTLRLSSNLKEIAIRSRYASINHYRNRRSHIQRNNRYYNFK